GRSTGGDTTLSKAILAARRALGDTAEAQTLIRTVPRFGYHWVGAVVEETAEPPPSVAPALPVAPAAAPRRQRNAAPVAVAVLLVLAAAWIVVHGSVAWRPRDAVTHTAGAPAGAAAVLPVDVLGEPEDAWLRLGLMDLFSNRLRDGGLSVIGSESVVALLRAGGAGDPREALLRADAQVRPIAVSAARHGAEWIVHATLADRTVDASAVDPIAAARAAADRLLEALGLPPHGTAARDAPTPTLDQLMQRTEAARLADDLDRARRLLDEAPAQWRDAPEARLRRAQIDARGGRFDEAGRRLRALLADLSAETQPTLRARVLASLCSIENQLDRADDALAPCSEAIDLGGAHGASDAVAIAYNNRAISHARRHDFAAAEADFARARVALAREGDLLALVRVDGNEATMLLGRGRPAEALPIFERVEHRFDALGLANETLIAIVDEIDACLELLRPADALAASERGWVLLPRVREATIRHQLQRLRADALAANGRLEEAHAVLEHVIGTADPAEEREPLALARASLAALELDGGHAELAAVLADQAVAGLPSAEDALRRARAAHLDVLARSALGDAAGAAAALDRLVRWSAGVPSTTFYADLAAAETASTPAAADALCERAAATAADLQLPSLVANAAVSCGRRLIARGELERAAIVVGRVARYADADFASAVLEAQLHRALGQRTPWQAALARAHALAGERRLPADLETFAASVPLADLGGKREGSAAEP
ncbi:MAG TPA: hypothetical protein VGC30_00570, partial [Dokdonella sp.]